MKKIACLLFSLAFCLPMLAQQTQDGPSILGELKDSTDAQRFADYYFRAEDFYRNGQYDLANNMLRECLRIDANNASVYARLSDVAYAQENYELFYHSLLLASNFDPQNTQYLELLTGWHLSIENYDLAEQNCLALLKLKPNNDRYLETLANIYKQTNLPQKRLKVLQQLEKNNGVSLDNTLEICEIFDGLNRPKDVEKQMLKLIDRFPNESNYKALLIAIYFEMGNIKKGYNYAKRELEIDPYNSQVWIILAESYAGIGDSTYYDEYMLNSLLDNRINFSDNEMRAKWLADYVTKLADEADSVVGDSIFAQWFDTFHEDLYLYRLHAYYLMRLNRTAQAEIELRRLISLNPTDNSVWEQLYGLCQNDTVKQKQVAREAFAQLPQNRTWAIILATLCFLSGDIDEAIAVLDESLKQTDDESKSVLLVMKGDYLSHIERYAKACEAYEMAFSYGYNDIYGKNNYAYILARGRQRLALAEKLSSEALKEDPMSFIYLDTYAYVLFVRGEYKLAKFYQERALTACENEPNVDVYEHFGDILFHLGETDKAVEYWQKAFEIEKREILAEKIAKRTYVSDVIDLTK